jgi:hypothetical protein
VNTWGVVGAKKAVAVEARVARRASFMVAKDRKCDRCRLPKR